MSSLADIVRDRRIVVCCGAGGVGKTTTATGLALAAARDGRRVLALTVDPSKRLAQTLGVDRNLPEPVSVPEERLRAAGIEPPGSLETWMLDPGLVANRVVERMAKSPDELERLMQNRIYKGITRMVAGMQEYMAMEALHEYATSGRYDLVILDTPPSRDALAFLDSPRRMRSFLDGRIFSLFVPSEGGGLVRRAARRLIGKVNSMVFGAETYAEMQEFFGSFSHILGALNSNASTMIDRLKDPNEVAFLLVTSPTSASVNDVRFFKRRTQEMGLPCAGFILNRSHALVEGRSMPDGSMVDELTPASASAIEKLQRLASIERAEMVRDQALLARLQAEVEDGMFAMATPTIPGGANELEALLNISDALVAK